MSQKKSPQYLEEVYGKRPQTEERAKRWLDSARAITQLHREKKLNKSALESETFALQLSAWFDPPQPGDRLLGRNRTSPIGMSPEPGGLGYYCDQRAIGTVMGLSSLSDSERDEWENIKEFWKTKTTTFSIESNPPESYHGVWGGGAWENSPGAIFGLVRLAGCQWDHHEILRDGLAGMQERLQHKLNYGAKNPSRLKAWITILEAFRDLFRRFKRESEELMNHYEGEASALAEAMAHDAEQLSEGQPQTFAQALQLIWVVDAGVGCLNHGRLDDDLVPFWKPDHDEENIALLEELWKRIEERKTVFNGRVIVGGIGRRYPEAADRVAHLCIEATSRHHGIEPQLTLRICDQQDPTLLDHAFEAIRKGRTFPMLYWDNNIVPSVEQAHGISRDLAEQWVPYGCGEYVILGRSIGTPNGIANAARILEELIFDLPLGSRELPGHNKGPTFENMEELWAAFDRRVQESMSALADWQVHTYRTTQRDTDLLPLSLMMSGAIDSEKAIFDEEGHLQGGTMELYGMVDAADSLRALAKMIYEDRALTWHQLREALLGDFRGYESLQAKLKRIVGYGNDEPTADTWVRRVHKSFCEHTMTEGRRAGLDSFLVVVINNWVNTAMGRYTGALPCGRNKASALANANGPRPGQDNEGPSALLSSMTSLELGIDAGTVQNLKLSPEWFEEGALGLKALLKQYEGQGGTQLMITVTKPEELKEAMEKPEDYGHLMVRVGGFSARFIDLPRDCQQEILERTLH